MKPIEFLCGELPYGEKPGVVLLAHHDDAGDKKVRAIATGFIAVVSPYIVLITASHAFDYWPGEKMFAKGPNGIVPLSDGKIVCSVKDDVAAIFFDSYALSQAISYPFCVESEEISNVADSGSNAIYQMHGFPRSKSKYSHVAKWSQEAMTVSFGQMRELPKRSRFFESVITPLCFELDLKDLRTNTGERAYGLKELDGMSGCPVVRHQVGAERLSKGRLVGMFVEWCNLTKTSVVVPWAHIERFVRSAANT